mmetsp:Transcript_43886/g.58187  ORF Transcript_43886/g.58187 Transcript_43886/m.58187 type:complete len:166 (-) Transcript_43886:666-1163(-)|eukprot:CAMPEP_0185569576 /NCGR_PEP_ID=MMETSP0434-20130131/2153_1 /TAXON_ID=626734 ORGANISM="Favella taraikaensis, Strain Fe Narragansett Bay" /NCGR_SAMPLE_ID=MMETSP0434 /ASSEMBLY_ACC=CAM_ASM_000379 /LENGTH=165 /DNA_ID=CAMNT_0028184395 /DNA_START=479 /DNA_END=976 /DNA_ORIENTATION=-
MIMIVQMETKYGSSQYFEENRDRRAFEVISKIVSGILERIYVNTRTAETHDRAYIILKTFSEFMGKKDHSCLSKSFEEKFPDLFGFETCGLLMIDNEDGGLFKISQPIIHPDSDVEDNTNPERTGRRRDFAVKPIIVRLPKDRGLTGLTIKEEGIVVAADGEYNI